MSSFISQNLAEIEAVRGCTFACICHTVFRMFPYLQINWQPFYLRQLLKFHPSDWLIEVYFQTEGQGSTTKLQDMAVTTSCLRELNLTNLNEIVKKYST